MSFKSAFMKLPLALKVVVFAIPAVGIGFIILDQFTPAEVTDWESRGAHAMDVCPSAREHIDVIISDAQLWVDATSWVLPVISDAPEGLCGRRPGIGHFQVRMCSDQAPPPFNKPCLPEHHDNVGWSDELQAGVIYLDDGGFPSRTVAHAIGHSLGFMDNRTGGSVMYYRSAEDDPFGRSFDGLDVR